MIYQSSVLTQPTPEKEILNQLYSYVVNRILCCYICALAIIILNMYIHICMPKLVNEHNFRNLESLESLFIANTNIIMRTAKLHTKNESSQYNIIHHYYKMVAQYCNSSIYVHSTNIELTNFSSLAIQLTANVYPQFSKIT